MAAAAMAAAKSIPQPRLLAVSPMRKLFSTSCQVNWNLFLDIAYCSVAFQVAEKQAPISISKSNDYADFVSWLKTRNEGGDLSPIRIELSSEGRAVFTSRRVGVGERLMDISPRLIITQRDLPKDFEGILHSSVRELTKIALVLLMERHKGNASAWAPYISFLPSGELQSTIFWKTQELRFLGESSLYKRTSNRLEMITAEFDKVQTVAALWPRLFGQGLTFQDFKQAFAIVLSRAFSVDDTISMVPVLDIANHNPPMAEKLGYNIANKGALIKATREYAEGDQVFVSYGELSNADLALDYGFVVPNNPFDEVEIFTQIPKTHPLQAIKKEVISKFGENSFLVREVKNGSVPRQLLATVLHICASSDPELKKMVAHYGGKDLTRGAKLLLDTFTDPQMRRLESAIRALDETLPSSVRKEMSLHVLFGELQLLHTLKAWLNNSDLM